MRADLVYLNPLLLTHAEVTFEDKTESDLTKFDRDGAKLRAQKVLAWYNNASQYYL